MKHGDEEYRRFKREHPVMAFTAYLTVIAVTMLSAGTMLVVVTFACALGYAMFVRFAQLLGVMS